MFITLRNKKKQKNTKKKQKNIGRTRGLSTNIVLLIIFVLALDHQLY